MTQDTLTLLLMAAYAAILLCAARWFGKTGTAQDFLIAGRQNSGLVMGAGIIIGWVDAMWFAFYGGLAFTLGLSSGVVVVGSILAFAVLASRAKHIQTLAAAHDMHGIGDWFRHHYGLTTCRIIGVALAVSFQAWLTATMVATGLVVSQLFALPYPVVVAGSALLLLPLLLKGGYRGLTRFDMLQMALVVVCLLFIYGFGFVDKNWLAAIDYRPVRQDIWGVASLLLTFFSATICAGDVWQRSFAAKSVGDVRKGFVFASVFCVPAWLAAAYIGFAVRGTTYHGAEDGVFAYAYAFLFTSQAQSVFLVLLLAASLSTLNVAIFGGATALAKDFYAKLPDADKLATRLQNIMAAMVVLAAAVALVSTDIMVIALSVLSACTCFVPLLLLSLMQVRLHSHLSAPLSAGAALLVYLGLLVSGQMTPLLSSLPLFINCAVLVAVEAIHRLQQGKKTA